MYRRLRELREDRDLNQKQIADLLKVAQTTCSRYESGALDMPSGSLVMLARFYGTSIDYILGMTNEKGPYKRNE